MFELYKERPADVTRKYSIPETQTADWILQWRREDEWRWLDIILDASWQNWLEFQHYNSYVPTSSCYFHTA
jgi:hypothetical protein